MKVIEFGLAAGFIVFCIFSGIALGIKMFEVLGIE